MMSNIEIFKTVLEEKVKQHYKLNFPTLYMNDISGNNSWKVQIIKGKKYIKIDIGNSGRFMYDMNDNYVYGIKAYGVINKRKNYGKLSTLILGNFEFDGYLITGV